MITIRHTPCSTGHQVVIEWWALLPSGERTQKMWTVATPVDDSRQPRAALLELAGLLTELGTTGDLSTGRRW